jgi:hypothetical protein
MTRAAIVILMLMLAAAPAGAQEIALPWTTPSGRGVGIGYELGQWGQGFGQGLRLRVPIYGGWGTALRGIVVGADDPARWSGGGRLEVYGQSPVFLNLFRIYGGGGVQLFHQWKGNHAGETRFGSGGQFGFEFFMSPHLGFFLEVGGNGNAHLVSGATVISGLTIYPR